MTAVLLSQLADRLGMRLTGQDREVTGVNTLAAAGPDQISFLANPKYADQLSATRAAAVICLERHADKVATALVSADPYLDFARTLQVFARPQGCLTGVSGEAYIHQEARVDPSATVYPFAFVGARAEVGAGARVFPHAYVGEDCRVGRDSVLYPGAVCMAGTVLGERVVVGPGTVLGADGFGFAGPGAEKIPQVGVVVVEDDVEIGANTCVDRAALDVTRVGRGSKLDNLVQVGHNVTLGPGCMLVAQVGVSGSTTVGSGVVMAGQVGLAGHLKIGDGVVIGPKSGVAKDIEAGKTVGGIPAMDRGTYLRYLALAPKLPDMARRVRALEKEVERLRTLSGQGGGQGAEDEQ